MSKNWNSRGIGAGSHQKPSVGEVFIFSGTCPTQFVAVDQDERMRNNINSKAFQPTSLDLLLDSLILGIFLSRVGDLLDGVGTGLNLPLVWFELLIVASICEQKSKDPNIHFTINLCIGLY